MASPEFQFTQNSLQKVEYGPLRTPSTSDASTGISTQGIDNATPLRPSTPGPCAWGQLTELKKIARGVFGDVYRAWDTHLEREVALKLYGPGAHQLDDWFQFGLREARMLARIRHRNVVTVYGVDHLERRLGIWMEYIRGRTLEALLRELGPLGAREAALIGFEVCSAVAAAHDLGFLHCDITSKNVMREDGGRIVLMDFGLSRDLNRPSADAVPRICGTPLYMAPELLRGELSSVQSDIYSIGILLYHLVTRGFPVEARSFSDIRAIHESGEIALLRDRRPDLPEAFLRTVERSLSFDAAARFATAGHMAKLLSALLK
jgi:serine/threonine protein kinase